MTDMSSLRSKRLFVTGQLQRELFVAEWLGEDVSPCVNRSSSTLTGQMNMFSLSLVRGCR